MIPADRAAIRRGVNLATLPASVIAGLAQERAECLAREQEVKRQAARLLPLRKERIKVERELGRLGDLGPPVRAELNKLIAGSRA